MATSSTTYRWYVYHLIDPRDGSIFYIGKGASHRDAAHEYDASRGEESRKADVIREIWDAGHHVIRQRVAYFCDEQMAYDHEADLISDVGLDNLTNILPGGEGGFSFPLYKQRAVQDTRPLHERLTDGVVQALADWIKAGGINGRVEVYGRPKYNIHGWVKFCNQIADKAFNEWLPEIRNRLLQDKESEVAINNRLSAYGVSLVG